MKNFDTSFEKSFSRHRNIFFTVFALTLITIVIAWGVIVYLGFKAYDEVNSHGGVAKTLGTFVKDFNDAKDGK